MSVYYFCNKKIVLILGSLKFSCLTVLKVKLNFLIRNTNEAIERSTFSPGENGLKKAHSHEDSCHCHLTMTSTDSVIGTGVSVLLASLHLTSQPPHEEGPIREPILEMRRQEQGG